MSWQERYIQNLRITTGDSEVFDLFTLPSFTKEVEYNGAEFNFVGIDGQLVRKRTIKARTFPLEFFFVGDNHLEDAASFEFSASHPDPWVIEHPYYDIIVAQVLSIKFDNTDLNVTKVTLTARETIIDGGFRVEINPREEIELKKDTLDAAMAEQEDIAPAIAEVDQIQQTIDQQYQTGVKIITLPEDAETYFNAFNEATSYVNTITASPVLAIQALTNMLTLPAQFEANVRDRIRILGDQIDNLRRTLTGLIGVQAKKMYTTQAIALVSGMCRAAVRPLAGNYTRATNALAISAIISERHEQFMTDLDGLQSPNGGNPEYFVPDFNLVSQLEDLVELTTSSLFEIALAGRKEFTYTLTEDSNVILLTHRFYRLDSLDNNLNEFIDNNNLTWREIALGLPKGKEVVYYA